MEVGGGSGPGWDKLLYMFEEGNARMRQILGGKGANLAEMTRIGLPVPPGFTITAQACVYYSATGSFPSGLDEALDDGIRALERRTGKSFGGEGEPLLLSVRSGAAVSMPGMMDTILNLGLNDRTVRGLAGATGDLRFALDCYRRFLTMFGNVVLRIPHDRFEDRLSAEKARVNARYDVDLGPESLERLCGEYKQLIRASSGSDFPQDPRQQLAMAVRAVFESWNNPRARVYRQVNRIPDDLGTAVNVQCMVFGNTGSDSGTGVVFTRDPATGARELYGEYLPNAQGEDVVAGIRTPRPISQLAGDMPQVYQELVRLCELLERHYADIQDIEFTVEHGRLYVLQTRAAKRTAAAAVKAAWDMAQEGLLSREEAVLRVDPDQVVKLLHRNIDPRAKLEVLATGLPASPGAASGRVVLDADRAEELGQQGERVILVRPETTPDDIHGIVAAQGVLTSRGGMTCHAAIVARHMGKPCVVGCDAVRVEPDSRELRIGERRLREGDLISIDGATGRVILGEVPLVEPELSPEFQGILAWADEFRRLKVRANADTPQDAQKARSLGAQGIGLCRTEHMFMDAGRLPVMQEMIMAETEEERKRALDRLLPMQQKDFEGILKAMEGYPVTIRLLDPPLHEFLPNVEELAVEVAKGRLLLELEGGDAGPSGGAGAAGEGGARVGRSSRAISPGDLARKEEVLRKARALAEFNPMLGLRGCRLGIVYPEIYHMQARAIFLATAALRRAGIDARPEIMMPLVGHPRELEVTRALVQQAAEEVRRETGVDVTCPIGTMIEVPRACVAADRVADHADFFSFGTNDLTQTTFGFSRDDAEGKFLPIYLEQGILRDNPFAVLDGDGVGVLVEMACRLGRKTRPDLKLGVCGEHGGEPRSIALFHRFGLDYVSCSPYRVPIARLAAAQAQLRETVGEREKVGE
ncbi:MAG: pyruvate, phosphate dikinase [Acetobacteraceae bacterium]|nr:pyruvate, phosphate dikinase [Acetobacteraceae bacterium]